MVYTITFNPALDYITQVENFKIGEINRTKMETILPGGKGLNVSIVLKNLEIENVIASIKENENNIHEKIHDSKILIIYLGEFELLKEEFKLS